MNDTGKDPNADPDVVDDAPEQEDSRRKIVTARNGSRPARFGTPTWGSVRYLPSFMRWCRVRFRSFLCFFLRIFFLRFLIRDGNPSRLSLGPEEVPEVNPLDAVRVLQANRTQSKRFGGLCHRREQPEAVVVGHVLQDAEPRESTMAV